jgi:hypothetical protein
MQIFLDSADEKELTHWLAEGVVDGVTTNPSILLKDGAGELESTTRRLAALLGHRPLSIEVTATEPAQMIAQGRTFSRWAANVVVKIPIVTQDGDSCLKVIYALSRAGIPVIADGGERVEIRHQCFAVRWHRAAQHFVRIDARAPQLGEHIGAHAGIGRNTQSQRAQRVVDAPLPQVVFAERAIHVRRKREQRARSQIIRLRAFGLARFVLAHGLLKPVGRVAGLKLRGLPPQLQSARARVYSPGKLIQTRQRRIVFGIRRSPPDCARKIPLASAPRVPRRNAHARRAPCGASQRHSKRSTPHPIDPVGEWTMSIHLRSAIGILRFPVRLEIPIWNRL